MDMITCVDIYGNTHKTTKSSLQWRPAAYGIVIRDGKVLLLRQFGGRYELPGGALELGEDHKRAVIREVKEETGIEVEEPIALGMEASFFKAAHSTNEAFHSLLLYFHCKFAGGEESSAAWDEIERKTVESIEWISVEAIDSLEVASTVDFRPFIRQAVGM